MAGTRRVALELSGLGFCGSNGLGALVSPHHAAQAAGVRLVVVAPRRQVADALALSGVDQLMAVYPSLSAVRAAFASGS